MKNWCSRIRLIIQCYYSMLHHYLSYTSGR